MRKGIVLLLLFFVFGAGLSAQQKYGHIDSDEILESMPEYTQLLATLERSQKQKENAFKAKYQDFMKRQQELQDLGPGMMVAIREEKMLELQQMQQELSTFEERSANELETLKNKLLKPLNDKYLKIVNAVARENGYTFIFDLARGAVVYHPEKDGDVTDLVKKKMGIIN